MMSKNVPVRIKIMILVNCWYLVVYQGERIFVYLSFYLGQYQFCLVYKLEWHKNKNLMKYSYPIGVVICETLIIDT